MEKYKGFKSLKVYNKKKKEIIIPGVDFEGVDPQQKIELIEEKYDEEY